MTRPPISTEQPVILAGMHRSGTSLAASLLHAGGVHMGEGLLAASRGNERGHFEDLRFVEFHRCILCAAGEAEAGWILDCPPLVPAQLFNEARQLAADAAATAGAAGWGWKDPRTTLFLNFWRELLPQARFVFLYRAPWEVADSIFRRGAAPDLLFKDHPADIIGVWSRYNQCILDFHQRYADQCIVVANDAVVADPVGFVTLINRRFGKDLAPPPPDAVDRRMVHQEMSASTRRDLVALMFPAAIDVLARLNALNAMPPAPTLPSVTPAPDAPPLNLADSFRDWFHRYHEARLCRQEREDLASARGWFEEKIASLESSLAHEQTHAAQLREHADRLKAELERQRDAFSRLDQASARLRDDAAQLREHADRLAVELERQREAFSRLDQASARLRDDAARVRQQWLESCAALTLRQAMIQALQLAQRRRGTATVTRLIRRPVWSLESLVAVTADPPEARNPSAPWPAWVLAGEFAAGHYALTLRFASPPSTGTLSLRFMDHHAQVLQEVPMDFDASPFGFHLARAAPLCAVCVACEFDSPPVEFRLTRR